MKKHKKHEPPQEIVLPIAPMLDMTFQLLSMFILTFRPAPLEGQITMNLPALKDTAPSKSVSDVPPALEPASKITLSVTDAKGGIGSITLKIGDLAPESVADTKDGMLVELRKILEKNRPGSSKDQQTVMIEATNELTYGALISVVNVCREANFGVGFNRPLP